MLKIGENAFRDHLFLHHKEDLASLIVGKRDAIEWTGDGFPPIRILLQRRAEKKINEVIAQLEQLEIVAKELRLERDEPHPTRIDLLGSSPATGATVIELKKSNQTERQSFTELLAYSNHLCSLFPGLTESAITSVLVAPMETRTARDAYTQELFSNRKNIVALVPHEDASKFTLEVFYPDASYYQWFENNILNDHSMTCVVLAFPLIEGWIDSDLASDTSAPPQYTIDALNTIANAIAQELEAHGFHAMVYGTQKWGEITSLFPYPNSIVVAAMNPFSSTRNGLHDGDVFGATQEGRIKQLQAIFDQFTDRGKEFFWVDAMESDFLGRLIRVIHGQFEQCLQTQVGKVRYETSLPDWYGLKTSFVDAVSTHNLNVYSTGLLREIYLEYVSFVFRTGEDPLYYYDDIPKFGYDMLHPFLAVWEIFRGLGHDEDVAVEVAENVGAVS